MERRIFTDSGLSDLIKDFLQRHKDANGKYKYVDAIDTCIQNVVPTVIISPIDFLETKVETGFEISSLMYVNPKRFLNATKRAVDEIFQQKRNEPDDKPKTVIAIEIDQVDYEVSVVEALSKNPIGKLVTIKGIIVYKSSVFNRCRKAVFTCEDNHPTVIEYDIDDNENKEPVICDSPTCKLRKLKINVDASEWETYRNIAIKSDEEFAMSNDEITVSLSGQLTEAVEAGDRIVLTGLVNTKHKPKSSIYINEIHCLYVRQLDDVDLNITPEDEEVFRKMIDEIDFYQRMINSIAPNILGNEDVKESLLLQQVRSPNKIRPDDHFRGWLNIGLWGDAGVAKTAMAEWISEHFPKTQIISSKGASSVGLTLGIDKDANNNNVLRAGAFVLNRGYGTVIIDEFPRLEPEVIDGIYTTIESGFASISKAGFQAKQRADASLIATGNAYGGIWNDNMNLTENLNMSSALATRFDYHWIIKDNSTKQKDLDIANAILFGVKHDESSKPFSSNMLVKYFKFVRRFEPVLSDEVAIYLRDSYVDLRADDKAKENDITPRHMNTLIRTTLAISRLYQREFAVIEDAEKAISLIRKNLNQRGISISEANTYTNRQFNRCIEILKDVSSMGIGLDDLFDKLLSSGSKEDIDQSVSDLGKETKIENNKKWRNVVIMLRRSIMINIISDRPMVLAYKHEKRG